MNQDDSCRLPSGFERISYDSNQGVYTFQDASGDLWESLPGNTYGPLHPVADVPLIFASESPYPTSTTPRGSPCHSASSSYSSTFSSRHGSFSITSPMLVFPSTWDPPTDYEAGDLPASKRIKSRVSIVGKNMLRPQQQSEVRGRQKSRAGSVFEKAASLVQGSRRRSEVGGKPAESGERVLRSVFEW